MGYNKDRGDTCRSPTRHSPRSTRRSELPLWKDPDILALAKELFKYGPSPRIIAYLMLKVVMPLIKTMLTPPPQAQARHVGTLGGNGQHCRRGSGDAAAPTAAEVLEQKLKPGARSSQQDPKVVANIIKDWTGANAS
jgi:flagellar M-ring protein FliF